ncbi:MAG: arsenate reductase family protein [Marinosulfonomonas sp.]
MILYGLSTCAVCKRAQKEIEAAGRDVQFRDIRAEPLSESELEALIVEFGDRLVDRKSSDWRGLSDWLKHSEADAQISAQPKLMVRPVIQEDDQYYLGWDDAVRSDLLGG